MAQKLAGCARLATLRARTPRAEVRLVPKWNCAADYERERIARLGQVTRGENQTRHIKPSRITKNPLDEPAFPIERAFSGAPMRGMILAVGVHPQAEHSERKEVPWRSG